MAVSAPPAVTTMTTTLPNDYDLFDAPSSVTKPAPTATTSSNGAARHTIMLQVISPRIPHDSNYYLYLHMRTSQQIWRDAVTLNASKHTALDIIHERKEDMEKLKFARFKMTVGDYHVFTDLSDNPDETYYFRVQSWPYGLMSQLCEFQVKFNNSETLKGKPQCCLVTLWIHGYLPVSDAGLCLMQFQAHCTQHVR